MKQHGQTGARDGALGFLTDEPDAHNLPNRLELPQDKILLSMLATAGAAILTGMVFALLLRGK